METLLEQGIRELIRYMGKYEKVKAEEARRLIYEEWEMVERMIDNGPLGAPLYRMISDELMCLITAPTNILHL